MLQKEKEQIYIVIADVTKFEINIMGEQIPYEAIVKTSIPMGLRAGASGGRSKIREKIRYLERAIRQGILIYP